jgi:uncharacterized metal-binding protein YceD (DUF177 family)
VNELREYQIPFVGMKLGLHHFNFELEDTFFSHFEGSEISQGKVFIDLEFDKKERLFVLNFDVSGSVLSECDRCGQAFDLPIHGNHTLYVKLGDKREEDVDNEEVIWIPESDSVLELAEVIYEFVHLSLPIKRTHPDLKDGSPGCDPEILKLLGTEPDETNENINDNKDPRWDILNNLNTN